MSASDRSSGRVEQVSPHDLVGADESAIRRADDDHPAGAHYGRRQLAQVRSQLSNRDLAVLRSLAALKFGTTKIIERLHFHGAELSPQWAARGSRQTLAQLYGLGLVDRLERRIGGVRAGSASFVYCLSPAGARLLRLSTRRRSREPSLAHLDHVLAVGELVVRLHERARAGGVDLLGVETEPDCWRQFVGHHGARATLKPDLRATLGIGEHELHWFVEVDRGSEHRAALVRKISAYLAAWRDGGEEARAGVFPRVLWVAPDNDRALAITRAWRSVRGVPSGLFVATTTDAAVAVLCKRPRPTSAGGDS